MIEFESSSGGKMRIQWKASAPPDWASLAARLAGHPRMIQITPQMRILVAVESVDFRKGIDSLAECMRLVNRSSQAGVKVGYWSHDRKQHGQDGRGADGLLAGAHR